MMDTHNTKKTGKAAEKKACEHLQANGLILVESNFFCSLGEIDLIMRDGEDLVFVEVRSRHRHIDDALESVDLYKQNKLVKVATFYLQKKQLYDKINCRFDIIAINDSKIEWIRDAFYADNF